MTAVRRLLAACSQTALAAFVISSAVAGSASAQDTVQIGLSTKAWFPSFVAEVADQQGFFQEEGVTAVLTVYQSGSEALTAIAAGSADVISTNPSILANGRAAGVDARMVSLLATRNHGWQIMVPADSPIETGADLEGRNVGITSAGSATDLLAGWAKQRFDVEFQTIPLGGGGLVPNLISGNVDAIVVFPPLSYQVAIDGNGTTLLDFGDEMPARLEAGWGASDAFAARHPDTLQKALNALARSVRYIKQNPDEAVPMLADYNGIAEEVARQEYEGTFLNLSDDGAMTLELVQTTLELFGSGGEGPDAAELFTSDFTPIDPAQ